MKKIEMRYSTERREVLVSNKDELTVLISGVKFTFLHYPFPVLLPFEQTGPVPLLSIGDIGRRGEFKDYVDIYAGLKGGHSTLDEIIALAQKKYQEAFNDRLFLEQLVYLDDIEEAEITMTSGQPPTKRDLIAYFSTVVRDAVAL